MTRHSTDSNTLTPTDAQAYAPVRSHTFDNAPDPRQRRQSAYFLYAPAALFAD